MQASRSVGMIICAATLIIAAAALSFTVNFAQLLSEDSTVSVGGDAGTAMPIILVDAGHGGVDGGAVSPIDGTVEKGLNLDIAAKTRDFLRLMGFRVQM
ncbi:MAG: N-acetylmuramoyl-L-alanine amidase, partial [Acutalibacteraceae bacterium]